MTNAHVNHPHVPDNLLWLKSYLIYLSFLGRDSFLSLFLKDLLPLLYIFIRGHSEGVVELIIAFVHHVPISVGLLQTVSTQLGMAKQTPHHQHTNGIKCTTHFLVLLPLLLLIFVIKQDSSLTITFPCCRRQDFVHTL